MGDITKHDDAKGTNELFGTTGNDLFFGRGGEDTFWFDVKTGARGTIVESALNTGDGIADYEYGETIHLEGVNLTTGNFTLEADGAGNSFLHVDLDRDGKSDASLFLVGVDAGVIDLVGQCCTGFSTQVKIYRNEEERRKAQLADAEARAFPPGSEGHDDGPPLDGSDGHRGSDTSDGQEWFAENGFSFAPDDGFFT